MIDLKLNELPVDATGDFADIPETELTPEQLAHSKRYREGLSISDTIAGDTMLSVGSRGVDTSGVVSGAGAGAGMSYISPADSGSPAPEIVPGARTSGTTPRADNQSDQIPTLRIDSGIPEDTIGSDEIATHAYHCWMERGCPSGSPEEDWNRAEQELRLRRLSTRSSAASA